MAFNVSPDLITYCVGELFGTVSADTASVPDNRTAPSAVATEIDTNLDALFMLFSTFRPTGLGTYDDA